MERYEIETRANDEQTANLVAKVMAGAVVAMALIVNLFTEPGERAKAMGIFGFVMAGGGSRSAHRAPM